jgi:hypothetical protein
MEINIPKFPLMMRQKLTWQGRKYIRELRETCINFAFRMTWLRYGLTFGTGGIHQCNGSCGLDLLAMQSLDSKPRWLWKVSSRTWSTVILPNLTVLALTW